MRATATGVCSSQPSWQAVSSPGAVTSPGAIDDDDDTDDGNDIDDDEALPFWDPNLYDYITPGEYEDIYGRKYNGEYDGYYTNLKRKAGKKFNGKNKRK